MNRVVVLLAFVFAVHASAAELKRVAFFQDTVSELDGRVVTFMLGSVWLLDHEIADVALSEGVIICAGPAPKYEKDKAKEYREACPKQGVFMYRGQAVGARLASGVFMLRDGYLTQVVRAHGRGAILETEDGSLWVIPRYDHYDAGYWLPPYPVIVFSDERYLLNLKEGKKVWIEKKMK